MNRLTSLEQLALEALEPFAAFAPPKAVPDHLPLTAGSGLARRQVTAAEFRRAAAVYELLRKGRPSTTTKEN